MKALSIRQPWAWAIVNGYKPVENRDTNFIGKFTGPVLIHAGRVAEPAHLPILRRMMAEEGHDPDDVPALEAMPRGGFVGRAVITGIVRHYNSAFFSGPFGIVLRGSQPMKLIAWPGQLGLFNVDPARLGLAEPETADQGTLI